MLDEIVKQALVQHVVEMEQAFCIEKVVDVNSSCGHCSVYRSHCEH